MIAVPVALLIPILLAIAGFVLVFMIGASLPVPGFYELAAQVIPLLLIAFTLEDKARAFLSDPGTRWYRVQFFLLLLAGEIFALLGASGALRGSLGELEHGLVASTPGWSNAIAAGTAAGLVGGLSMLVVLALSSGPGWLNFRLGKGERADQEELELLREQVQSLEGQINELRRDV